MKDKEFLEYVQEHILEYLEEGEKLQVQVEKVNKNNGVCMDSLFIKKEGKSVYPCIYLQEYYKRFQEGTKLADIMEEIARIYQEAQDVEQVEQVVNADYEQCKDHLFFQLVNVGLNSELWEHTPYLPWQDLALTVRLLVLQNENGISSILVTNQELEKWGVTWQTVCEEAKKNTPILFQAQMIPMKPFWDQTPVLYILTNEIGINGATCICYDNILSDFAKKQKCNFFLLPSSIHEILLLPDRGIHDEERLIETVDHVNKTVVEEKEILSYQIYYYDYKTGNIDIITKK